MNVKITPEIAKILRKQRKKFIKKFGREPGPNDPVFFDPNASTPVEYDADKVQAAFLNAMLAARTPPELVYAFQKTGLIVNETGYKSMSPEDRAEYEAAIAEYLAMERAQEKKAKQ